MKETIVFFGSGPVAAQSLALLVKSFQIEAVVTKPKPDHHKGSFPVIDTANELGITLQTVSNRAELSSLMQRNPFKSQVGILIDFGIIVSQDVIDYFPFGIVNSHFSILPQWRGADPITFALLSGQKTTGVSLMLIDKGMDTGKILVTKSLPITPDDSAASLTNKLIDLSSDLLASSVPKYIDGRLKPRSQSHPDRATYSRKLIKTDGILDWGKPAEVLEREIRAYSNWPKSSAVLGGKEVIVTRAHVVPGDTPTMELGSIDTANRELVIQTAQNRLSIDRLKPAGKKEMTAAAFLAGYGHLLK